MSKAPIEINNIIIHNTTSFFSQPFKLDVAYFCTQKLEKEVSWQLFYIIDNDESKDILLKEVSTTPKNQGLTKFTITADALPISSIKQEDLIGVHALILKVLYRQQEFLRIGYFVYTFIQSDDTQPQPSLNSVFPASALQRKIIIKSPTVTRFQIKWDQIADNNSQIINKLRENERVLSEITNKYKHRRADSNDFTDSSGSKAESPEQSEALKLLYSQKIATNNQLSMATITENHIRTRYTSNNTAGANNKDQINSWPQPV